MVCGNLEPDKPEQSPAASIQFPDPPKPRNLGEETRDALEAQIDLAPDIFRSEAEFRPRYALLEADILKDVLSGRGGLLPYYENTLAPSFRRIGAGDRRAGVEADISAVEEFGPRAIEAFKTASPESAEILDELNRQAIEELKAGRKLTPAEIRDVTQSSRAAFNDRGMVRSNPAIFDEVAQNYNLGNRRLAERRGFAGDVLGYNKSIAGDPFMAVLGRPSSNIGAIQTQSQLGSQYANAGPQIFEQFPGYAQSLHAGNQQAATNYYNQQQRAALDQWNTIYNANSAYDIGMLNAGAGVLGGVIGAGGAIGGSVLGAAMLCWVARAVYGESNAKWLWFRQWMVRRASRKLFRVYVKYGERVAGWVSRSKLIKSIIRGWMDKKVVEVGYAL